MPPSLFVPSARFPARAPLFAIHGDSIPGASIARFSSTVRTYSYRGPSAWLAALTHQRLRTRPDLNFGVFGETTTQMRARTDQVARSDADIVIMFGGGRNNLTGTVNQAMFDTFVSDHSAMWDQILASGKELWVVPMLTSDWATSSYRDMSFRFMAWLKSQAFYGRKGVVFFDANQYWVNPTSANSAPKTGYSYEGESPTHPNMLGAYHCVKQMAAYANARFPHPGYTMDSVADVYSTDNPLGNLSANGFLTGTGGTTSGAGGGANGTISGSVPSSSVMVHALNGGNFTSITTTLTQPNTADGRPGFKFVIAGTSYTGAGGAQVNNASRVQLRQTLGTLSRFAVGDKIYAECEFAIDANAAQISGIETQLQITDGGVAYVVGDGGTDGDIFPTDAITMTHRTPYHTLGAQPTVVQVEVRAYLRNGAQTNPALGALLSGLVVRKEAF